MPIKSCVYRSSSFFNAFVCQGLIPCKSLASTQVCVWESNLSRFMSGGFVHLSVVHLTGS